MILYEKNKLKNKLSKKGFIIQRFTAKEEIIIIKLFYINIFEPIPI